MDGIFNKSDLDLATKLQNGLISVAVFEPDRGIDYSSLRRYFICKPEFNDKLPDFVRDCRDLDQFRDWILSQKDMPDERTMLIWNAFEPLLDYLEDQYMSPAVVHTFAIRLWIK